jgi:hypothetical protein
MLQCILAVRSIRVSYVPLLRDSGVPLIRIMQPSVSCHSSVGRNRKVKYHIQERSLEAEMVSSQQPEAFVRRVSTLGSGQSGRQARHLSRDGEQAQTVLSTNNTVYARFGIDRVAIIRRLSGARVYYGLSNSSTASFLPSTVQRL